VRQDIERFLAYLSVEKGFSDNTRFAYQNDLYYLMSFTEDQLTKRDAIPTWANFTRQDMLGYMLNLKERGYAATTQARKVARVI
jgi:integrase/recombinase XerD